MTSSRTLRKSNHHNSKDHVDEQQKQDLHTSDEGGIVNTLNNSSHSTTVLSFDFSHVNNKHTISVLLILLIFVLGWKWLDGGFSSHSYLNWKPLSRSLKLMNQLKGHDQLFNTSLMAFKPLISKITPSFHNHVLQNQKFVETLKVGNETTVLQDLIDMSIYGGPEVQCNHMDTALIVLFILNRAEGDFMSLKSKCLQFVKDSIRFENILDILDRINAFIQRDEESHSKSSISLKKLTILDQLKEYCLDFLGTNSDQLGYEKFVENDPRMIQYFKPAFKRKKIRALNLTEIVHPVESHPMSVLFKTGFEGDLEFHLSNRKIVKAHKTVLLNSNYTELHGLILNNNSTIVKENEEMEYLLQYCYGFLDRVPPRLLIPVIKKAHQYGMKELIHLLQPLLQITVRNFFEWSHELKDVMDDLSLRKQFAEFGAQYGQSLFTVAKNFNYLKTLHSELKNDIIIAYSNQEKH
ncbi:hypothetical protein C9374_005573 [Naegleria lovaniensis]|uniref:BTB domain-containing protein n=1 Tax=Naegleria lovaniensis TaxID=51637 RepID=A0AA88KNA7_NAELO|nr:uncharacterized protein C9374_005573 [Naegleria lovaniensis]KAG2382371.1 hypothetical protein C9374_005573 [Naegleria lovaniensis]